jgi:hypothetical protein
MEDKEIKELEKAVEQIWEIARRFGLDPYPTNFEIVPATVMYEVGSYALPGRYSHWTFGKTYHRMKTMYDFGLSKIYEHRSGLRFSARDEQSDSEQDGDCSRPGARRLLQKQLLFLKD